MEYTFTVAFIISMGQRGWLALPIDICILHLNF